MPVDMKEKIAEAARKLVMEKNVKKLTVKDIVEECNITRQAFYYHFEDIPALFRWILEKDTERLFNEVRAQADPEQGLRYFFKMAVNVAPYVRRGMESGYRYELEHMLTQYLYRFFEKVIEEENLYQGSSYYEIRLIMRYHSQAVMGILREWTEEDTKNLDRIVHEVYLLMAGKVTPRS
jgi:AcrR family transcriptional regulator